MKLNFKNNIAQIKKSNKFSTASYAAPNQICSKACGKSNNATACVINIDINNFSAFSSSCDNFLSRSNDLIVFQIIIIVIAHEENKNLLKLRAK